MSPREETSGVRVTDSTATPQVEYHEPTNSYRTEFDNQTRLATHAVVTAVATAADTDPLELPPLRSVLDPDALNGFFASSTYERDHDESAITFEYADHVVTVNGHGTVLVEPSEDSRS